jgi:DNA invertase Pin-like site-specific DNA recombinase
VSTDHQALEAQHDALTAAGCERIFTDKLPGSRDDRPGLAGLLSYTRGGDVVVVVALDRLDRPLSGIYRTVEALTEAGGCARCERASTPRLPPGGCSPASSPRWLPTSGS